MYYVFVCTTAADKEKENLKHEVTKIRKQIASSGTIVGNQAVELSKLAQIITEADEEKQRQSKELEAILGEKTMLNR